MKVLILATGEDTGGVGVAISRAFSRHSPRSSVRFVRRSENYIKYPKDIEWLPGDDATEARVTALWQEADVVHFFQRWSYMEHPEWPLKPKVIHHHGRGFRNNPDAWIAEGEKYDATAICSTVDLVAFAPDKLHWMPNPYNLDALAATRARLYKPNAAVRIAHAPTIRSGKSTEIFLAACNRLSKEARIEVDLIERVPWDVCLQRKATADIYYDQVLTAYGNNAVEAWGMGIPVIAGVDSARAAALDMKVPASTRDEMLKLWGEIPFVEATEATIYDALKALLDKDYREMHAARGLEHVRRWHDEAVVVKMLTAIYEGVA